MDALPLILLEFLRIMRSPFCSGMMFCSTSGQKRNQAVFLERDHFHSADYVAPTENFVDVDTTEDSPEASLVYILSEVGL